MASDQRHARDASSRLGRRTAAAVLTLACLGLGSARVQASTLDAEAGGTAVAQAPDPGSAVAEADGAVTAARAGLAWRWEALPRDGRHLTPFDTVSAVRGAATAIDYRLWFGDQRTEVGLGFTPGTFGRAQASAPTDFAPHEAPGMVLAFRQQVSAQSRLTFNTQLIGGGDAHPGPTRRMAFDLGVESSPLHGLAKGTLLRAQLNAHSNLALRLRGGRLGLYLGVRITGAE